MRGRGVGPPLYVVGRYMACVVIGRAAYVVVVASFVDTGCGTLAVAADGPCTSLRLRDGGFAACSRLASVVIVAVAAAVAGNAGGQRPSLRG